MSTIWAVALTITSLPSWYSFRISSKIGLFSSRPVSRGRWLSSEGTITLSGTACGCLSAILLTQPHALAIVLLMVSLVSTSSSSVLEASLPALLSSLDSELRVAGCVHSDSSCDESVPSMMASLPRALDLMYSYRQSMHVITMCTSNSSGRMLMVMLRTFLISSSTFSFLPCASYMQYVTFQSVDSDASLTAYDSSICSLRILTVWSTKLVKPALVPTARELSATSATSFSTVMPVWTLSFSARSASSEISSSGPKLKSNSSCCRQLKISGTILSRNGVNCSPYTLAMLEMNAKPDSLSLPLAEWIALYDASISGCAYGANASEPTARAIDEMFSNVCARSSMSSSVMPSIWSMLAMNFSRNLIDGSKIGWMIWLDGRLIASSFKSLRASVCGDASSFSFSSSSFSSSSSASSSSSLATRRAHVAICPPSFACEILDFLYAMHCVNVLSAKHRISSSRSLFIDVSIIRLMMSTKLSPSSFMSSRTKLLNAVNSSLVLSVSENESELFSRCTMLGSSDRNEGASFVSKASSSSMYAEMTSNAETDVTWMSREAWSCKVEANRDRKSCECSNQSAGNVSKIQKMMNTAISLVCTLESWAPPTSDCSRVGHLWSGISISAMAATILAEECLMLLDLYANAKFSRDSLICALRLSSSVSHCFGTNFLASTAASCLTLSSAEF
ncbi:hypothetical protein OGATHE_001392 [Ogataea polymorpha]|uniref:Uncharacterized protein n=1 Tax=Ogataea polymorpha TaxID=460523 RepID=A0A9P8PSP3_9ASCO|nr:hypothetical protein OGATHE_001392 [Ogataea polymorpha]